MKWAWHCSAWDLGGAREQGGDGVRADWNTISWRLAELHWFRPGIRATECGRRGGSTFIRAAEKCQTALMSWKMQPVKTKLSKHITPYYSGLSKCNAFKGRCPSFQTFWNFEKIVIVIIDQRKWPVSHVCLSVYLFRCNQRIEWTIVLRIHRCNADSANASFSWNWHRSTSYRLNC